MNRKDVYEIILKKGDVFLNSNYSQSLYEVGCEYFVKCLGIFFSIDNCWQTCMELVELLVVMFYFLKQMKIDIFSTIDRKQLTFNCR